MSIHTHRKVLSVKALRRGFTLIELLVVIAIIAILAAILFPMLLSAKKRAQSAQCLNGMGQIGKAMIMYADQNNGNLPFAYNPPDWGRWDVNTWRERIVPLLKNKRILICGVKTKYPVQSAFRSPGPYWPDYWKQMHYGMNVYVACVQSYEGLGSLARPLSSITSATRTILVSENMDGDWSAEPWDNGTTGSEGRFWPYHGGTDTKGGNFIWCDGHATFMPVSQTQATISGVPFYYWKVRKTP